MNIKCNSATYEALRKILEVERIPYTTGIGPQCFVVVIDKQDMKVFTKIIYQWQLAIASVVDQL